MAGALACGGRGLASSSMRAISSGMLDIKDEVCKKDELDGRVDGVRAREQQRSERGCMCYEPYEIRAVWVYGDIRGSYEHRLYGYTVNQPYRRERAGAYGYTPKLYTAATRYGLTAGSGRRSSLPKFHDLAERGPRALAAQLRRQPPARTMG
mgnify:CR=1 FL=1